MTESPRTYHRIDDETAAAMSAELAGGVPLGVVATRRGLHYSSASYAIKRWRKKHGEPPAEPPQTSIADREDGWTDSLRSRILNAVADGQTYDTVGDLIKVVANGGALGDHEVMHILYSLGRQHLVTFQETRRGTNQKVLTTIHQVKAVGTDRHVTKTKHFEAVTEVEVLEPEPILPEPQPIAAEPNLDEFPSKYPLIDALIAREERLRKAAELLEAAGQDELALNVLDKVDALTPLEQEVLRYFREAV